MTLPLWLSLLQLNTWDIPQAIVYWPPLCRVACNDNYGIALNAYGKHVARQFMRLC